jgi:hypothetical protein
MNGTCLISCTSGAGFEAVWSTAGLARAPHLSAPLHLRRGLQHPERSIDSPGMSAAGQHSGEVGEVWDWQANDANRLQSAQIHAASEWNRKTDRAHVFGFATPWLHPPGETVAVLVLL